MSLHLDAMETLKKLQLPETTWPFVNDRGQRPIIIFLDSDTTPDLILRLWDAELDDPYSNFIVVQETYFEIVQVPVDKALLNEFLEAHSHLPKTESFALTAKKFIDWIAETREVASFKVSYA